MALIYWNYRKSNGDFWIRFGRFGIAFYKKPLFSDRIFNRKKYFGRYIQILK